ncbi:heavy-metal-associated domain-containing protein [Polaribacter pectinis]|uniref:Heavy-metal-associated domain-containing protein n=1 Tax=Polaribacter pectinis TaxID=2738844 RepID=A0A7G9L9X5_9FLAO|nr:heavy metal-associated domain-containing protein [Polaribacter pectinis]QNM85424.1 heavy-metal-associated domain-containing protein [Polaribacter pectinis]
MKVQKIIYSIAIVCFVLIGCKENKEPKKEVKKESVALAISGMTCEIGCAKTIQSKLSKKEGVIDAKVVFTDSIANIEFDANTTSKKDLIAFVDGIAGGDLYKASESTSTNTSKEHNCSDACKEKCEHKMGDKTACKEDCKMACCADKKS